MDKNYLLFEDIAKYASNHGIFIELSDYNEVTAEYSIRWGDWKHSHLRFKFLVGQYAKEHNLTKLHYMGEEITEEDGSDCYSAKHLVCFLGQ